MGQGMTWHAEYCREAWRLYDLWLMAAQDMDAFDDVVLALRHNLDSHLQGCKKCKREQR
jgi:hypothetical protein